MQGPESSLPTGESLLTGGLFPGPSATGLVSCVLISCVSGKALYPDEEVGISIRIRSDRVSQVRWDCRWYPGAAFPGNAPWLHKSSKGAGHLSGVGEADIALPVAQLTDGLSTIFVDLVPLDAFGADLPSATASFVIERRFIASPALVASPPRGVFPCVPVDLVELPEVEPFSPAVLLDIPLLMDLANPAIVLPLRRL